MKAAFYDRLGPARDVLQLGEVPDPIPIAGELRVRIQWSGVNPSDVKSRMGLRAGTMPFPRVIPHSDGMGVIDAVGDGVPSSRLDQRVWTWNAAWGRPHGTACEFVCLPQRELVPVSPGLDAAEAVSLVLNYITAYQMLHRSAKVVSGQRALIHGAAGGVGTALLQLGRLAGLEMYGTCSSRSAPVVSDLGGTPIDYKDQDYVKEIHRLTSEGVDVVFDPIGGAHLWHSRQALRPGGRVVGYGLRSSLRGEGLASGRPGRRQRFRGTAMFALYIAGGWLLPGHKRVVPYSIQTLKRLKPDFFRADLIALFDLLRQKKIKPLIAQRFPLAEARHAQELLAKGGVTGKIVLVLNGAG